MSRGTVTRLGLQFSGYRFPGASDADTFDRVSAIARAAENAGFDSIWTMDHVQQIQTVGASDEPILEAYTTLAALAAVTNQVRLGVLVTAGGFRNAALLAKMVTTIDVISHGRAILGVGAGWYADEYSAYGVPFPRMDARLTRLEETVRICREMFAGRPLKLAGEHFSVSEPLNVPGPLTPGGPPILIGGSGERRLIPMIARYADACNFFGGPAMVRRKIDILNRACDAIGRDPATITKTWLGAAIVADSASELRPALESLGQKLGVPATATKTFNLCGSADEVQQQAERYRAVGIDGLIVTLPDAPTAERVARVGHALGDVFAPAANGKGPDRARRLPEPCRDAVAIVWAEVLGTPGVDPDVGFFDLGGDSHKLIQSVGLLRARWPGLKVGDVFSHPTVNALAAFLDDTISTSER